VPVPALWFTAFLDGTRPPSRALLAELSGQQSYKNLGFSDRLSLASNQRQQSNLYARYACLPPRLIL